MSELLYKDEAYGIVGACMEVHRELGSGFLEAIYQEALEKEFIEQKIPYAREKNLRVRYKGQLLSKQYIADFLCFDKIIVELKAVKELSKEHEAQLFNYLKTTGLQLGLLINFGEASLRSKRIICTTGKYNYGSNK